jgi:electron transport complex protein RnfG
MKEMVRYGFILALICLAAAGLLAGVNPLTGGKIIAQAQAEEESVLKEVMPAAGRFEAVKSGGETVYYKAYDKNGNLLGVVFKAAGKDYSGTIETMAGMLKDGTITSIKILGQEEAPALGARVARAEFTDLFKNKNSRDLADIQAVTGATISSRAVIDSVKKKAEEIKGLLNSE